MLVVLHVSVWPLAFAFLNFNSLFEDTNTEKNCFIIISFLLNFQWFKFYKEYAEFTIQSDILDLRWMATVQRF